MKRKGNGKPNQPTLPEENAARTVILSAEGIVKTFASGTVMTEALRGIDLKVFRGEFLVVLGESGCGKTTLLNIIGGIERASAGHLYYGETDLCTCSERTRMLYRRNDVGFIFQNYNLMPNLNVIKNLKLIGELVKDSGDAFEILRRVGLAGKEKNYPCQLSGGEQQRVSIARALMKKPKILVADEPTAALDYATSIEVLTAFEDLRSQDTTVVMVTHNEQIARMADRVVRMRDGRICATVENAHPAAAKELVW